MISEYKTSFPDEERMMKNTMRFYNGTLVWMILLLVGSCLSPYEGGGEGNGLPETGNPVQYASELFTGEGIDTEPGERITRFYTNDPKYRTVGGYTLWTAGDGDTEAPFSSRTVTVRKVSGSAAAGYGLVLCEAPRTVEGGTEQVYLVVFINNNGQYALGKVYGGRYESLVWWKPSAALYRGSGAVNTITVTKDEENANTYHLFLNTVPVETFTDGSAPQCNAQGRSGYIVVIAPSDLDRSAVEAWFYE
jgi:hypothetical protein